MLILQANSFLHILVDRLQLVLTALQILSFIISFSESIDKE